MSQSDKSPYIVGNLRHVAHTFLRGTRTLPCLRPTVVRFELAREHFVLKLQPNIIRTRSMKNPAWLR